MSFCYFSLSAKFKPYGDSFLDVSSPANWVQGRILISLFQEGIGKDAFLGVLCFVDDHDAFDYFNY